MIKVVGFLLCLWIYISNGIINDDDPITLVRGGQYMKCGNTITQIPSNGVIPDGCQIFYTLGP